MLDTYPLLSTHQILEKVNGKMLMTGQVGFAVISKEPSKIHLGPEL
jgi:hypothetical protein